METKGWSVKVFQIPKRASLYGDVKMKHLKEEHKCHLHPSIHPRSFIPPRPSSSFPFMTIMVMSPSLTILVLPVIQSDPQFPVNYKHMKLAVSLFSFSLPLSLPLPSSFIIIRLSSSSSLNNTKPALFTSFLFTRLANYADE